MRRLCPVLKRLLYLLSIVVIFSAARPVSAQTTECKDTDVVDCRNDVEASFFWAPRLIISRALNSISL
jgi:hypothetical protein